MEELIGFLTEDHYLKSIYTKIVKWKQGDVIYCNAENGEFVGCIIKGQAVLRFCYEDGNQTVTFLDQYDLLGIENLVEDSAELRGGAYEVVALTDVTTFTAKKDYYLDHMYANPKYFHCVLSQLAKKSLNAQAF
ncbi:Crp/Fnr family transcriptional regulator [Listeria booriae]|uniref:cyclic nucleotide-binding domain-containing protein n=1 Tax=Listeria booriae TaxID=1552123 RepID=UPI00164D772B|nr:cyclic nucleotide-binding domain-containing protein [Listeria booriae]MBC6162688.1 Crp/Fnr family transcriptional regulator [Listeria booriae]